MTASYCPAGVKGHPGYPGEEGKPGYPGKPGQDGQDFRDSCGGGSYGEHGNTGGFDGYNTGFTAYVNFYRKAVSLYTNSFFYFISATTDLWTVSARTSWPDRLPGQNWLPGQERTARPTGSARQEWLPGQSGVSGKWSYGAFKKDKW